jgi:rhodanese-related sulfurtransferase
MHHKKGNKQYGSVLPYRLCRNMTVLLPLYLILHPPLLMAGETPTGTGSRPERSCPVELSADTSGVAPSPPALDVLKPRHRDRSCFVAPDVVAKQSKTNPFTLVDVRSTDDFERMRIPGSLNIPLHLIKAKTFLKTRSIVLVNDGRTSNELEESCGSLKQAGFQHVSILDGGLHAWSERKQPVEGDSSARLALNKLKPSELFSERSYDDWVVVNVSTTSSSTSREVQKALPRKVVTLKMTGKTVPVA